MMLKDRLDLARKARPEARFIIGVGSPAEEIVSMAKSEKTEMIVIGRLLRGDKLLTIGSVARWVSETAACPVMIVT